MSEGPTFARPRIASGDGGHRLGNTLARLLPVVAPVVILLAVSAAGRVRTPGDAARSSPGAEQLLLKARELRREAPAASQRRALDLLAQAGQIFAAQGDAHGQATSLLEAADTYRDLSELSKAKAAYARAESLARSEPDVLAAILNGRARMYLDWWDSENAEADAEAALKLSRESGNRREEAAALVNRGEARYLRTEDVPAARDVADGMALAEAQGDSTTVAFATRAMALIEEDQGRFHRVIELMRHAEELFRGVGDLRREVNAAVDTASIQAIVGDREAVLATHTNGLRLLRTMGHRTGEAWALAALGVDYAQLNNRRTAIEYFQAAQQVFRQLRHVSGEYSTADSLCRSQLTIGQLQSAIRNCTEAKALSAQLHDPKREAIAMQALAETQVSVGKNEDALWLYTQAAKLSRSVNDPRFEAMSRLAIGSLRERAHDISGAIDEYRAAAALSATAEEPDAIIAAHCAIARAQRGRAELTEARAELEQALRLSEEQRAKVGSSAQRSSYFASLRQAYELYAQVLLELHKQRPDEHLDRVALEQSEKAHARTLLDALAERNAEIAQTQNPDTAKRLRELRSRIEAASHERMRLLAFGGSRKQLDDNMERMRLLNAEYDAVRSSSRQSADAPEKTASASVEQIQRDVLGDDTTLLEYLLGDDASVGWAVTSQSVTAFSLPPRKAIEAEVQRWHALILARKPRASESAEAYAARVQRADRELQVVGAKLACSLVAPILPQLKTSRIVVVPDGTLEYVPFAALPLDGCGGKSSAAMVSRFEVTVAPSASSMLALRRGRETRSRPTSGIAVLADPVFTSDDPRVGRHATAAPRPSGALGAAMRDLGWNAGIPRLPGTRLEAKTIAAHAPSGAMLLALDFDANITTAMRPELARYRILHFATHGLLDSEQPEFSGLILSLVDRNGKDENGYLSAQDIYEQHLSAELVVLSACDSGLGATLRGEGVVGLARAFLHAGAARVVSSLWKVDDEATSELMRHFYDGVLRDRKPPAAALRYAQLQMMQQKREPFYWAGFVLNGEWR